MAEAEDEYFCGSTYHCEYIPFLRFWPVLAIPLGAVFYLLAFVFAFFVLLLAMGAALVKYVFPDKTKHIGHERLMVVGATGPDAAKINGMYDPTEELIEYTTVYRKLGDPGTCLKIQNNLCGLQAYWAVAVYDSTASNKPEYAKCEINARCLPHQCPPAKWKLKDLANDEEVPCPTLVIITLEGAAQAQASEQGQQMAAVVAVEPMQDCQVNGRRGYGASGRVYIDDTPVAHAEVVVAGQPSAANVLYVEPEYQPQPQYQQYQQPQIQLQLLQPQLQPQYQQPQYQQPHYQQPQYQQPQIQLQLQPQFQLQYQQPQIQLQLQPQFQLQMQPQHQPQPQQPPQQQPQHQPQPQQPQHQPQQPQPLGTHASAAPAYTYTSAPPALPQLPVGWIEQHDPSNGRPFFVYTPTGLTQWDPPALAPPR
jgi:hypothetical protein